MINTAAQVRKQIYALLSNAVSYNSSIVPVYDGQSSEVVNYKIIIGDYTDADRSNKHKFGSLAAQIIEVVGEQPTAVKKHVDAIGELVMNELHPSTRSSLWSSGGLSIAVNGRPNVSHLIEESGEGSNMIVRLILRYNLLITEN